MFKSTSHVTNTQSRISIMGFGPVVQGMVYTSLAAGISVAVLSCTTSKAEALAENGAIQAETPKEALNANRLIIFSLTEYKV